MNDSNNEKKEKSKFKRPKSKTNSTTNPGCSHTKQNITPHIGEQDSVAPSCQLLAKDSEWVDIVQTPIPEPEHRGPPNNLSDEEEVLQLVDCEEGPEMKPLAILFPKLLEADPATLQGMLNKAMSTTEVTRHLVNLGEKANFTFMKKADRLIPHDKLRMESLTEKNSSYCSIDSKRFQSNKSSDYDADTETVEDENSLKMRKKRLSKSYEISGLPSVCLRIREEKVVSHHNSSENDVASK